MTKGFSLLEILATIIVFTIGIIALSHAFSVGIFAFTDFENVDLALNIAQAKMEDVFYDLKNTDLESLNEGNYETANSGTDPDFSSFDVAVALTDQTHPHQELFMVDVTVTWDARGPATETSLTLTTLVADLDL